MPFCKNCGEELAEGARYCRKCGASTSRFQEQVLAGWGERFIAWLIDMIVLGIVLAWLSLPGFNWISRFWSGTFPDWIPFVDFGFNNVVYFIYWTFMEGTYGQSIGKMIMKIVVTDLDGKQVDIGKAAFQSIGKAFLLPIDCILGWILYQQNHQRLFNYLSETIVLKNNENRVTV
jgi:uncharacterized RDD family membrane protein YckC